MSNNQNERIDPPLAGDDESLREYGRQLAMDSLMIQALLDREVENHNGNIVPLMPRRWRPGVWIPAAAAALVAVVGLSLWKSGDTPSPSSNVTLDPRWVILAAAGADYRILDPNHVELRMGELHFTSLQPAALVVDTPNATSTAQGTDFLIRHHLAENEPTSQNPHQAANKHNPNQQNSMNKPSSITRLLVYAGSVVLATDQGRLTAGPNEAIIAKAGEPPQKLLLDAALDAAGPQKEINIASQNISEYWDKKLAEVEKKVVLKLTADERVQFEASKQRFITYREKEVEFRTSFYGRGTIRSSMTSSAYSGITEQRVRELENLIVDILHTRVDNP
jgi:uncharacterized protein YecT (DUF1311 family)